MVVTIMLTYNFYSDFNKIQYLQRWLPLEGFSGRLLPTDRYNFSNQDGTVDRSRDKVRLPSMAWQWEGDWQIETTLDGQPLDHDVNMIKFL